MIILLWIVIVALAAIGLIHVSNIAAIRQAYDEWRYPKGFHVVTGVLELGAAALLVLPSSRVWGLALGAAICGAAILTLLHHRQFSHLVAPVLLAAGLACLWFG